MAPESMEGGRSEPDMDGGATAGAAAPGGAGIPEQEVSSKASRRQFSARYKLRILKAVEAAQDSGEIGAILRREGLYSSHLTKWRSQREKGALAALGPRPRGPAPEPKNPLAGRVAELEGENRRLKARIAQAEAVLSIQKKVSELLGIPLDPQESVGRPS